MKRGYPFQLVSIFTIVIIGIMIFGWTILYGQEASPFYLNLFKKGEKSFFAKNYMDAVKELEIAAFGLLGEKKLRVRAYIYLSLSYYYLENLDKSEKYLRDAENLLENEGFTSLEIAESVLSELQEIASYFNKEREAQRERAERLALKNKNRRKEIQKKFDRAAINKLEMKIKSDPQNTAFYFELFGLYRRNNNLKAGRKTLEKLIKKNSAEVKAYYLLGITYYKERRYKEAVKNFEKIFDLTKNIQIDQSMLGEAGAYLVLSAHAQGDRKRALLLIAGLMSYLPEERIGSSSLSKRDKVTLQDIVKTYKRNSKTDRNK